jgi:hypothetical protein
VAAPWFGALSTDEIMYGHNLQRKRRRGPAGSFGKVYDISVTDLTRVDMPAWIRALAGARPFGAGDRRGTANLIDSAARARGAAGISSGRSVSR